MIQIINKQFNNKRVHVIIGIFLFAGLLFQCQHAWSERIENSTAIQAQKVQIQPKPNMAFASITTDSINRTESLEEFAQRAPMEFLQYALDQYDRSIRDYTCTFSKQELVNGTLSKKQVMEAMFREKPFSVRLKWIKNQDKCHRVLYVADRWVEDNKQMAVVEPGAIARLFVPYVMRAINGKDAKKASRRTIDQFGVRNSLVLTLKYCLMAKDKNILNFKYIGKDKVDNRPTFVFERRLPYTCKENCIWPDRVLIVHIDQEYLLPTRCVSYADDEKTILLGKYETTNLKINVNLPDSVFTKKGMGL